MMTMQKKRNYLFAETIEEEEFTIRTKEKSK
jgi:hypothetical protein